MQHCGRDPTCKQLAPNAEHQQMVPTMRSLASLEALIAVVLNNNNLLVHIIVHLFYTIRKHVLGLLGLQKLPMYKLLSSLHIPDYFRSLTLDPIKYVYWHLNWLTIYNKSRWKSSTILHTIIESQPSNRYICQSIFSTLMNQTPNDQFFCPVLLLSLPISLRLVSWRHDNLSIKQA